MTWMQNKSMLKTLKFPNRSSREIFTAVLPHVILPLVRKRIIKEDDLGDSSRLYRLVRENIKTATKEMEWCCAIDDSFVNESIRFWRRDERFIAILLYSTAVEQYVNQMFQLILMGQGWRKKHVTCLLKEVTFDGKLGWMFEAFVKRRFPARLSRRLRAVYSVRNAIAHFKGETGHPDRRDDSYSKIELQMQGLRRMSISRDFRLLNEVFTCALLRVDTDRELVVRITNAINDLRNARNHTKCVTGT